MEKLLHERLRECESYQDAQDELGLNGYPFDAFAKVLANKIERCYIPRPRFEDGEPIDWGSSEIEWKDGGNYAFNAINEDGIPCALGTSFICAKAKMTDEGLVKRLTPKVYDADGVPCKQGETIYSISKGIEYEIVKLGSNIPDDCHEMTIRDTNGHEFRANGKFYTHECPVFDAEGVRIRRGDTVWSIYPTCKS